MLRFIPFVFGGLAIAYAARTLENTKRLEVTKKAVAAKAWGELDTRTILKRTNWPLYEIKELEYQALLRDLDALRHTKDMDALKLVVMKLRLHSFARGKKESDALLAAIREEKGIEEAILEFERAHF